MDEGETNEEFDCPRGCGKMSYEIDFAAKLEDANFLIILGAPVIGAIYFFGSFVGGGEPSIGVLFLFFVASCIGVWKGLLKEYHCHTCQLCRGVLLDSKTMLKAFSEEEATKINSLLDGMEESSSELQCPVCDETMGTFSVPYVGTWGPVKPIDDILSPLSSLIGPIHQLDLDACGDCRVVWFDGIDDGSGGFNDGLSEMNRLLGGLAAATILAKEGKEAS